MIRSCPRPVAFRPLRAPHGTDIAPLDDTLGLGTIRVMLPIAAQFRGRGYPTPLNVTAAATVMGTAIGAMHSWGQDAHCQLEGWGRHS